jgi:Secretion system C-terminal sorting domain
MYRYPNHLPFSLPVSQLFSQETKHGNVPFANILPSISNFCFKQNTAGTNVITCNASNGGCIGYEFNQTQTTTNWFPLNQMNNQHYYGLLVNNAGVLPIQKTPTTTPGNIDNTWNYTPSASNQFYTYVFNSPLPTATFGAMYVRASSVLPHTTPPNALNWATPPTSRYTAPTNITIVSNPVTPVCAAIPTTPSTGIVSNGGTIGVLNGTAVASTNAALYSYVAQKNIYNALKANPSDAAASTDIQTFFNTANATTHPYRKLWDIEQALSAQNWTTAISLNNAFAPANAIETNYKTYFGLHIAIVKDSLYTAANNTALYTLANLCPHNSGNIIFDARSLYNSTFPNNYTIFQDDCDKTGGLYKKENDVQSSEINNNFTVNLYPNPTDNQVHIQTNLLNDVIINIIVTDIAGNTIIKQDCNTKFGTCSVSLEGYAKGIYIFKITNSANETIIKKVVLE